MNNTTQKKICSNCGKVIPYTATCECKKKANRLRNAEKDKRKPEEKKFFNSTRWKKLRKRIMDRDGGYCQRCLIKYNIITTSSLEAHHIKPRNKYPELRWNVDNLVTLCKSCNTSIGTKEELDFPFEMPNDDERGYVL
ncbi:HNH endonuclease [Neobacillus mesonae]|nr:HNH endonuclease [Neobacillus mesonae]